MNAFPSPRDPKTGSDDKGMTLRDYFAAKAMQGFAAACANENDFESWIENNHGMAKSAYEWADAMLKARDK